MKILKEMFTDKYVLTLLAITIFLMISMLVMIKMTHSVIVIIVVGIIELLIHWACIAYVIIKKF